MHNQQVIVPKDTEPTFRSCQQEQWQNFMKADDTNEFAEVCNKTLFMMIKKQHNRLLASFLYPSVPGPIGAFREEKGLMFGNEAETAHARVLEQRSGMMLRYHAHTWTVHGESTRAAWTNARVQYCDTVHLDDDTAEIHETALLPQNIWYQEGMSAYTLRFPMMGTLPERSPEKHLLAFIVITSRARLEQLKDANGQINSFSQKYENQEFAVYHTAQSFSNKTENLNRDVALVFQGVHLNDVRTKLTHLMHGVHYREQAAGDNLNQLYPHPSKSWHHDAFEEYANRVKQGDTGKEGTWRVPTNNQKAILHKLPDNWAPDNNPRMHNAQPLCRNGVHNIFDTRVLLSDAFNIRRILMFLPKACIRRVTAITNKRSTWIRNWPHESSFELPAIRKATQHFYSLLLDWLVFHQDPESQQKPIRGHMISVFTQIPSSRLITMMNEFKPLLIDFSYGQSLSHLWLHPAVILANTSEQSQSTHAKMHHIDPQEEQASSFKHTSTTRI